MYSYRERRIKKEEYDAINTGTMNMIDLFDDSQIMGYGASPRKVFERDGEYFVGYYMSDSCD